MNEKDAAVGRDVELVAGLPHLDGCPAGAHGVGEAGSRVEAFDHFSPGGAVYRIARCVECGAQATSPAPSEGPAAA